jgi:serine/threonine-protein phosphatase 2A regulatory subunit B
MEEEKNENEEKNEDEIKIPKVTHGEATIEHQSKKIFANTHAYHINSLCLNSDGETFLSADDLRINIWNMNYTSQCFTIVDIKVNFY